MPKRFLTSLGFQIGAAFLLLWTLFALASLHALGALERQVTYDRLVDIAARLELSAQQLHAQAMNYKQNAPRDYPTYHRDVGLYYQDLMAHVAIFDEVVDSFMRGDFRTRMPGPLPWLQPSVGARVTGAIHTLEETWAAYRKGLFAALGPDMAEPRLEYAAEHNMTNATPLETASRSLTDDLRQWAEREHQRVRQIAVWVNVLSALLALAILLILRSRALAPLRRTIGGFQRVADGDFGHRLAVTGAAEVRSLTESFNRLAERLDVLFQLLGRLQQGNGLDEVLGFLARDFPGLLRIDWVGVLMQSGDGGSARLEVSYLDGRPERAAKPLFRLRGSLLERALEGGEPMHIPNLEGTATENPAYEFLRTLPERGLRDAIFLPITSRSQSPIPAVLVFASRTPASYDAAHLHFLSNIAQLVTHSFGRTVRLAEHARLAAIGEFASGIAHELRTPLTTVGLALEHFDGLDLPEGARKRLALARREAERMRRLLEDILLYAKPLDLRLTPLSVTDVVARFVEDNRGLATPRGQAFRLEGGRSQSRIMADEHRLIQVLGNLTQNACEAAPDAAEITLSVTDDPAAGTLTIAVHNPGTPIPPELLGRITEPFFSTKPSGTGLGLAIVKRLTALQGGDLSISSAEGMGTCIRLTFPRLELPAVQDAMAPTPTGSRSRHGAVGAG